MRRIAIIPVLLLGVVGPTSPTVAATAVVDVPPILFDGEGGQIRLLLDVYPARPAEGMPVKVCDGGDCETYNVTSAYQPMATGTGYVISIGERFGKRPVTAQIPLDLVDGANGWSTPSNAVTGWVDPAEWFKSRSNRPPLEVHFKSLDPTSIVRVDVCANYAEGQTLKKNISGYTAFSLDGYTSITYALLENGVQIRTEDLSSLLAASAPYGAMTDIPLCGGGILGSSLMRTIDGLTAGRTYKLTYTVSGEGKPTATAVLSFITPGACPTGDVTLPPSPRTYYFGVLGPDSVLLSYTADATYQWRWQSALVDRMAPIYLSASKVTPYKGDILRETNLRGRSEKWRYLRDIDDWAVVVDNAGTIASSSVLAYTVFSSCTPSQLNTVLTVDESVVKAADQACTIDANQVVPTKPGRCIVKASVTVAGVSSSGLRKSAGAASVQMNYVFTSVKTQDTADQTRAVLIVNNGSSSSTSSATSNYVRTAASGAKATLTINLTTKQTVKIYRKVGGKLTLLKTVSAKAGKTTFVTLYRKTFSFVVKDAKGRVIPPRVSSSVFRLGLIEVR